MRRWWVWLRALCCDGAVRQGAGKGYLAIWADVDIRKTTLTVRNIGEPGTFTALDTDAPLYFVPPPPRLAWLRAEIVGLWRMLMR